MQASALASEASPSFHRFVLRNGEDFHSSQVVDRTQLKFVKSTNVRGFVLFGLSIHCELEHGRSFRSFVPVELGKSAVARRLAQTLVAC